YRRSVFRAVEAAERHRDRIGVVVTEGQRGAAGGAEVAVAQRGAGEGGGGATRPGEIAAPNRGERRERTAHRLLAHAAMAQMNPFRRAGNQVTYSAALATAGQPVCRSLQGHADFSAFTPRI